MRMLLVWKKLNRNHSKKLFLFCSDQTSASDILRMHSISSAWSGCGWEHWNSMDKTRSLFRDYLKLFSLYFDIVY